MRKIDITPDQRLLVDAADRYLRDNYSFEQRSARLKKEAEPRIWRDFADLGWLGLGFDPDNGGSGGTMLDLSLLLEGFGRHLVTEPFVATVALAGRMIERHGSPAQVEKWIPPLVEGRLRASLAIAEPDSGYDMRRISCSVTDGRMNGRKSVVLGADEADLLLIPARLSDADGTVGILAVERDRPGISIRDYRTIDGRGAAEIELSDVAVSSADLVGTPEAGASMLEEAALAGTVALLGEAVGVLDGAVATTASYLNMRRQFDRPLSSFQALRHRVADMFVLKEEVKALCRLAADSFDTETGAERQAAIAAAAAYAGRFGRQVCEEAVQMHGAIAITDEYVVGHYLKRMILIDRYFGDVDVQMDIYVANAVPFAGRGFAKPFA
jgi:alkylation response protein AidB-like acyl-CoA dehydrogenase